jgi:hypothetical protein
MSDAADAHVPVFLGGVADAGSGDVLLLEGDMSLSPGPTPPGVAAARFEASPPGSHFLGCPCCRPRGPLVRALARLFGARARGETAFFRRVVLVLRQPADPASVAAAIAADPVAAARFRLLRRDGTAGR